MTLPSMTIPQPIDGAETVLYSLGSKLSAGRELVNVENIMAMSTAASVSKRQFGPGPDEMQVSRPELPEQVKGVLAQYTKI